MNKISKSVSLVALVVTVVPSAMFFFDVIEIEPAKWITLAGTIVWFLTAPLWVGRASAASTANV